MTIEDRPRGTLSPADRRYLKNPGEYSDQAAYERRNAIRERVWDGVLDMSLLFESLPESERKKIFGLRTGMFSTDGDDGPLKLNPDEIRAAEEGLRDGVGFFYQVANDIGENRQRVVEDGVRRGEERRRSTHKAEVSIEVETYDTQRLANRARKNVERGEELTGAQVQAALERKTVDPERLAAYVRGDSPEDGPGGVRDGKREEHGDDTEREE